MHREASTTCKKLENEAGVGRGWGSTRGGQGVSPEVRGISCSSNRCLRALSVGTRAECCQLYHQGAAQGTFREANAETTGQGAVKIRICFGESVDAGWAEERAKLQSLWVKSSANPRGL